MFVLGVTVAVDEWQWQWMGGSGSGWVAVAVAWVAVDGWQCVGGRSF
jgi:hypothetical protein